MHCRRRHRQAGRGTSVTGRAVVDLELDQPRCASWFAGSFIFCNADAFRAVGGFSSELFVAEEIDLSKRFKRLGKRQQGRRW